MNHIAESDLIKVCFDFMFEKPISFKPRNYTEAIIYEHSRNRG